LENRSVVFCVLVAPVRGECRKILRFSDETSAGAICASGMSGSAFEPTNAFSRSCVIDRRRVHARSSVVWARDGRVRGRFDE
jgi:hypothetical protein